MSGPGFLNPGLAHADTELTHVTELELTGTAMADTTGGRRDIVDEPRPARHHMSPRGRVGLFSLIQILAATVLYSSSVANLSPLRDVPFRVSWLMLAAAFGAAEVFVVHLHFRKDAHSFSLSEVALLIGLIFADPRQIVFARLLGGGIALVLHRRQSGVKLAFNLSHLAFETTLATMVYRWVLAGHGHLSPSGWAAAFAATALTDILSAFTITAVIALYEGRVESRQLFEVLIAGVASALVNTSLALIGATVVWQDLRTIWLLLVLAGTLFVFYRAFTALSQRYASLELLYDFTRNVGRSLQVDSVMRAMLSQARDLLRAERAEITLLATETHEAIRTSIDAEDNMVTEVVSLQPGSSFELRVADSGHATLVPRHARDESLRQMLGAGDLKDAMVAPLHADSGIIGTFLVGNRLGDVSTFDREDLKLFETLANHAGVSLENGRLIDRLRTEAAEKEHQSLHDALTGLPNRTLFNQRVQNAIESARRFGTECAVMLMDLDRFKEVNDTLGHHNGDLLLTEIATRLETVLDGRGTIARLGGDEFAILLPQIAQPQHAGKVAEEVLAALQQPIVLKELTLDVGASIGVALYPSHGDEAAMLLQRADVAMYAAKAAHSGYELYAAERDQYSPRRLALVGELRNAIEQGELSVHYQPKADLRTGEVIGCEALVRWAHPRHGFLPPDEFIPVAEHTGLIRPLTLYVLRSALEQVATWRGQGLNITMAANLSVRSLLDFSMPDEVARLLWEIDVPASALTLEITESSIMADPGRTIGVLSRLSAMGVKLAIDDFGTGYSSLSYLKRLPVDEVKIDKSFVMNMINDENDAVIVRSTADLGHNLGLKVVAEGVEDRATWDRLANHGVDIAQGYFLAKPAPPAVFEEWLGTWTLDGLPHTPAEPTERRPHRPLPATGRPPFLRL
jgi:diguanylate cyclase (GGDEF)-like protein